MFILASIKQAWTVLPNLFPPETLSKPSRKTSADYTTIHTRLGASQVALGVKNLPANARDAGLISGSGSSPGGGHDNPLQKSCLENSMDRGAWQAAVDGVPKSGTWLKWLSTHTPQKREQQSMLQCPWEDWHRIWAVNQNLACRDFQVYSSILLWEWSGEVSIWLKQDLSQPGKEGR